MPNSSRAEYESPRLQHFATDDDQLSVVSLQRARFEHVFDRLPQLGIRPRVRHAANSAATLRDSRVWYDLVRPGLMMYGVIPPPLASTIPLKPALSLRSRVVAVKGVRVGEVVGYGARWSVPKPGVRGRAGWIARWSRSTEEGASLL